MPYVDDPGGFDRVCPEKKPESVRERVLRIARETCDERSDDAEPLSVESRMGVDVDWSSLESIDWALRIEKEFGPFPETSHFLSWALPGCVRRHETLNRELFGFLKERGVEFGWWSPITLGHIILFFESREQG